MIQLRPPSSGAAALSPESVSDNMRRARMQAEEEEVHSAQARQRQRVGEIAALKAKAEAKRQEGSKLVVNRAAHWSLQPGGVM